MLPNATITVTDFASPDLATALGLPPSGSAPEAVDEWAAAVAQAVVLAKLHSASGPGTVRFASTATGGEIVLKAGKIAVAQPIESARVAKNKADRVAADRAKARKVIQAVPSIVKAAVVNTAAKATTAVAKGISNVVGTKSAAPLNAANRPPQTATPATPQAPARR